MSNRDFYAGIITTLLLLRLHDNGVIFEEVMATMSEKEQQALMRHAERNGEYDLADFEYYGFQLEGRKAGVNE